MLLRAFLVVLIVAKSACAFEPLCDSTSKGFLPLPELYGTYKGQPGGLYPGGLNLPPAMHDSAGRTLALNYQPLDTLGQYDPNGAYVLLSVGMSNCTQEFRQFLLDIAGDTTLHPNLSVVDGAQGGQTAAKIKYDTANFWNVIETRLDTIGLSPLQVQAIWLKEANASPNDSFPVHATQLRNDLRDVIRVTKQKYPNLRQVFLSSRIYGGYASTPLNPEPYAYESGFSVRWLIEAQIDGNDSLSYIPDSGDVNAPWLAWGPYLWADGLVPRASDSLIWECSDFSATDGTHPALTGRQKVSAMLVDFFKTSQYTAPWFLKSAPPAGMRGDLNGSGTITSGDIIALVNVVFKGAPPPDPAEIADVDCSASITSADIIYLVNFVFKGGAPPCAL